VSPSSLPAEASKLRAQALVDSGNSAYRAADYSSAAKRYAAAAVVNPDDPAAFYGLGMALSKLGRDDEARVAYAHSRELSRGEVARTRCRTRCATEGRRTRSSEPPAEDGRPRTWALELGPSASAPFQGACAGT
jgi:tetratricopeptide (TPR) repeat protein